MRRGHPGIGGWRNENPRHFRPRNGGNQHFRPSRGYGLLDQHRFPPPDSRPHRPSQPFKQRPSSDDHTSHDRHDRGKYRHNHRHNTYPRIQEDSRHQHNEQTYPMPRHIRPSDASFINSYSKEPPNYYDSSNKHCHMNNMGDIDDRYIPPRQHSILPWENVNQYKDAHKLHHSKNYRYDTGESTSKLPLHDYTGHRPPSSDHYGGNPTPVINNSESFNRSVDDTVNIIRKRLLNRNDTHADSNETAFGHTAEIPTVEKSKEIIQDFQKDPPVRKDVQRRRLSDKSSSGTSITKIKSKIVNQLFKMDKEKIHKLMDNPNSSSKFEYAISSLITESQYSFNRHMRSVAEKSLHMSSSMDFIQNDNNTIYEDTFMKQMQCILDPQDTVLLEDIKPIVMAELSKALQLDEYEQTLEVCEEEVNQLRYEQQGYNNEFYDNQFNDHNNHLQNSDMPDPTYQHPTKVEYSEHRYPESVQETNEGINKECDEINREMNSENNVVVFEATPRRRRSHHLSSERSDTLDTISARKSLDERLSELQFASNMHDELESPCFDTKSESQPLFASNTEFHIEDDDDPFEELDNQYHVAVDHSFIDNDDSFHLEGNNQSSVSNNNANIEIDLNTSENDLLNIKQEIEHQLKDIALSPLKLPLNANDEVKSEESKTILNVEQKNSNDSHLIHTSHLEKASCADSSENTDSNKFNEINKEVNKSDNHTSKSTSKLIPRKRSIDQSPSHRKEKRKKSESVQHESNKHIHNKKTLINSNNNGSKSSKVHAKKSFPEKHTKRKESQKKVDQKGNDPQKKCKSSESLIPSLSPKECNNTITNSKPQCKPEVKMALKTFDIFREQPKKVHIHQAHRNTSFPSVSSVKPISQPKTKQASNITKVNASVPEVKKYQSKETQTNEAKSSCSRFSQTDKRKYIAKGTQTDPVIRKGSVRSSNDTLERMKEIDMEIQVLLQEKFKLYSSIETGDSGTNSLQNLGMAVVNVTSSEDAIVEDFTSIPVEELEQIALESVEIKETENNNRPQTRNSRLKALDKEKSKSQSPVPMPQRKNKKVETPNISLIEQIISDDRPIEEIISLEDLENMSVKTPVKTPKSKRKLKRKAPVKTKAPTPSTDCNEFVLKDCTVLVIREDFRKYFSDSLLHLPDQNEQENFDDLPVQCESIDQEQNDLSEEPVVNDIDFDMLDVSEDIVIGDICEIKTAGEKEESDGSGVQITEDIILDNSQSSLEDQQGMNSDSKENECKMFDYSDENLQRDSVVVTGNADAVLAIECIENNFLAACLNGNVYYFSGDGQLITTLRGSNLAVTCLTIVKEKYGTTVYTGSLDSRIRYYDLDTGLEKGPECNVLSPIQTMDRAWDTIFVGTRTGFVLQFECKNNMLIPVSTVQFSDQSILALRAMKEGPRKVLLVAARSENVTIKDAQTGLLLRTLAGPKMTVYTLLYEDGKVYCGTSSSQIHVFDYSSGSHVGAHEGGKGAVCLRAAGGLLFAGCYDGCVYVYREGERRPFAQLRGPGLMLLSLAVVGSKIIAGYKDRSLYIWKIPLSILQEMIL